MLIPSIRPYVGLLLSQLRDMVRYRNVGVGKDAMSQNNGGRSGHAHKTVNQNISAPVLLQEVCSFNELGQDEFFRLVQPLVNFVLKSMDKVERPHLCCGAYNNSDLAKRKLIYIICNCRTAIVE